jgi:adenylate kinase family enzyme
MIDERQVCLPAKIAIIGPTSAGKTTLGRRLAAATGAHHIELDGLFHGPNWTPAEDETFRAAVTAAIDRPAWVSDGNYRAIRDITLGNADLVLWLDFPLPLIMSRLFRRTMLRWWRREELWNGNREDLRLHFMSRQSLFLWALQTHYRHRRVYPSEFVRCRARRVVRFRSPQALERWLRERGIH